MKPDPQPTPKREITHWPLRPFVILVAGFFAFITVMLFVLGGLTKRWTHHTWPPKGPVRSVASTPEWNTTAPQLQPDPFTSLAAWQKHEYQQLHTTGWTDNTHTYAVIPVERAMDLIATAEADHRLNEVLPPPRPATSIDLQNQKSTEAAQKP